MVSVIVSLTESALTWDVGLWACLGEIILTALTEVGRAAWWWWYHSPGWWRKGALYSDCECSMTGYFMFQLPSPLCQYELNPVSFLYTLKLFLFSNNRIIGSKGFVPSTWWTKVKM